MNGSIRKYPFRFLYICFSLKKRPNYTNKQTNKQTAILPGKVAASAALSKTGFLSLCLLVVLSISATISFGQPPPLPPTYWEDAWLGDDAATTYALTYEEAFWQLVYDSEIEECIGTLAIYSAITIQGESDNNGIINPITVMVDPTEWSGDFEIDKALLLLKAGLSTNPGKYYVSHVAFFLYINNSYSGHHFFPGDNVRISTGLPYPCDCIQVYFDTTNRKLYIGKGYMCD